MALTSKISAIAEAIRQKTGSAEKMALAEMPDKIRGIGCPVTAFAENTANGCHVTYGVTVEDNDYVLSLDGCVMANTEKIAFIFCGTGFEIETLASDSNLKIYVYDASQFELKKYTYTVGGIAKSLLVVIKKSTASADANALKSVLLNTSGADGSVIPLSLSLDAYGTYMVVVQVISSKAGVQVNGLRIH